MTAGPLPESSVGWLHDLARRIAGVLYLPVFRVRVHGLASVPRTGPVVLVANHSTWFEPQLIFGMLPRRSAFLVKAELFTGPFGRALRAIGQIPVHRGRPDPAPLRAARGLLAEGGLVGIFPEGTRGAGDVAAAEQGAAWLVRASGAVVLPVASRGTLHAGRRRFRPVVDLLVGEPFTVHVAPGRAGLVQATEEIRAVLAALVVELDRRRTAQQTSKAGRR